MTRRLLSLLTVATFAFAAACGSGSDSDRGSGGGSAGADAGDLDAFCDQFDAVMPIMFFAGFVSAFAELEDDDAAAQAATGYFPLLFSQQLSAFYADAAELTSGATSDALRAAADAYGNGVEYLERAGLSDAEIEALANLDVREIADDDSPELEDFGADIDEDQLEAESRAFQQSINDVEADLDDLDDTGGEEFEALIERCATAVTGGVDPCELLTDAEVEAALGATASPSGPESGFGVGTGCSWDADDAQLGVFVANANYFTQMQGNYDDGDLEFARVGDLGDDAILVAGFSSASSFSSDGATLAVLDGDRTVVVAVERDDDPIGESDLVPLAEAVLDRLG